MKRAMVNIWILVILVVTFGVWALTPEEEFAGIEGVDSILTNYVIAAGGQRALTALSTRQVKGSVVTDLPSRQTPVHESCAVEAVTKSPVSYVIETKTDSGLLVEGFDGEKVWRGDGTTNDTQTGYNRLAFLLNPQGPLLIETYFPDLEYRGKDTVGDREVYVLIPGRLPVDTSALYFDIETGLLVQIGNYWTIGEYRSVDGVKIPHRIEITRKGGSTVYEWESIRHNVEVNDEDFMSH